METAALLTAGMDASGWVAVPELIASLRCKPTEAEVRCAVETNNKVPPLQQASLLTSSSILTLLAAEAEGDSRCSCTWLQCPPPKDPKDLFCQCVNGLLSHIRVCADMKHPPHCRKDLCWSRPSSRWAGSRQCVRRRYGAQHA